jgi:DNA repair protein RadC
MEELSPSSKSGIKSWAADDRPREKMLEKGQIALSDAELLAILIQNGTREKSAVDLAREILTLANHNLNRLARMGLSDYKKVKGIGSAKAITLMAAMELGRRRQAEEVPDDISITSSKIAAGMLIPVLQDYPHEVFCVMYLNRANKLIQKEILSQGGVSGTVVDVRMIMKRALELLASAVFVAHNHPSGNIRPSNADLQLTEKIKNAASLFDIVLLDHIIVGQQQYFSFADEGIL